ncbi:hypothetical protein ACIQMR_35855 [Streptomyces sp. NPDC091376]|uniref:hypothetical protein n=1 Tax=Streptomyces sp. NPDC091376 TaxID=3365994 RepID=UPI0037F38E8B
MAGRPAGWPEQEFGWDHNLIALGEATSTWPRRRPTLRSLHLHRPRPRPTTHGTAAYRLRRPRREHFYDQIAWFTKGQKRRPELTLDSGTGGQVDFVHHLQDDKTLTELSWRISDHFPLWGEFTIPAR